MAGPDGRSPLKPRQLHDLRLAPTAEDPRPTFVWSAESPRDAGDLTKTTPYPRLLWHRETHQEITVATAEDHAQLGAEWDVWPPEYVAPDPMEEMRAALEMLTPEEKALLVEGQRQTRLDALQARMAQLPDAALETLLADAKTEATAGPVDGEAADEAEPAPKRGRPRKAG